MLDSGLLGNFRWTDELFTKALRSFETCLSVNNNLGWKFDSSLESTTIFDKNLKLIQYHILFLKSVPDSDL